MAAPSRPGPQICPAVILREPGTQPNWPSVSSVQFSCLAVSDSLRPHGLQHTRLLCSSPAPRAYSSSCPLSRDAIQASPPLLSPFPPAFSLSSIRVFSNESVFHIRWPKYWSFTFSISPSNEYSGLISFRIDWCDLLAM